MECKDQIVWKGVQEIALKYNYFIFGLDGILWHQNEQHIIKWFHNIEYLRSRGKKVFFITNSSAESRESLAGKIYSQVKLYVDIRHLYPASTFAGIFVRQNLPEVRKIWMVGNQNMKEEL